MRRTKNVVRVQKGGRREVGIGVGEAVLAVVGGRARHGAADAARAAHGEEADDERERGPTPAAGAGDRTLRPPLPPAARR